MPPCLLCLTACLQSPHWYLGLGMFSMHLVRRLLETALLMQYPPHARMHVIAYLFGCVYYVVAPMSLLPDQLWAWGHERGSSMWQHLAGTIGRHGKCAHWQVRTLVWTWDMT